MAERGLLQAVADADVELERAEQALADAAASLEKALPESGFTSADDARREILTY